ncbi:MAG TPA: hypothetical protein VFL12_08180 [Thermoanaerobaculia bacterium]|nr:hypothetical protein [Thermoanaerobaculia bacterium]
MIPPNPVVGSTALLPHRESRSFWIAKDRHRGESFRIFEVNASESPLHFRFGSRADAEWFLVSRGISESKAWDAVDMARADGISSIQVSIDPSHPI